jgi:hypothetical protein
MDALDPTKSNIGILSIKELLENVRKKYMLVMEERFIFISEH